MMRHRDFHKYRAEAERVMAHLSPEERNAWALHAARTHPGFGPAHAGCRKGQAWKKVAIILAVILGLLALYRFARGQTVTPPPSSGSGSALPSGMIAFVDSGSCPNGWAQVAANGDYFLATVAANGDVGTSGGSSIYTPAGTNGAPSFTGNAGTVPAEPFSGNPGTVPAQTISWPIATPTFSGTQGTVPAESFTGTQGIVPAHTITWPSSVPTFAGAAGTVPAETITWPASAPTQAADTFGATKFTTSGSGTAAFTSESARGAISWPASAPTSSSVSFTPGGTIGWPASAPTENDVNFTPAGTNGTVSFTPAGTVTWPVNVPTNQTVGFTPSGSNTSVSFTPTGSVSAPTFSGQAASIQPTFYKVIGCRAP